MKCSKCRYEDECEEIYMLDDAVSGTAHIDRYDAVLSRVKEIVSKECVLFEEVKEFPKKKQREPLSHKLALRFRGTK